MLISKYLAVDPRGGWIGRPERLKNEKYELWSRRTNESHQVIYEIKENKVSIVSAWGYYEEI